MRGRRVGFFLYVKRRLTLSELYYCFDVIDEISALSAAKKFFSVYFRLKTIVRILTTRKRFVFFWDVLCLKKIFSAHGMGSNRGVEADPPHSVKKRLLQLGAQLAAQTGGTAWEKLQNLTTDEVQFHTDAVLKEKLEKWRNFAMAYHAPKEFMSYLKEVQNYLNRPDDSHDTPDSLQDRIRRAIERSPNRDRKKLPHHASAEILNFGSRKQGAA